MNSDVSPELLGRRMDRLLGMSRAILWTHVALGSLSGATWVVALIFFVSGLSHHRGPTYTRGGSSLVAIAFLFAALPLILSYLNSADREAETFARFVVFLIGLVGISIVANVAVVWILLTHYSALAFFLVYTTQLSAYAVVGRVLLEPGPNSDDFGW
jgi:hypothetical protein